MTYVIAQPCVDVKDRACVMECPEDCIYEGNRMLCISSSERVDRRASTPGVDADVWSPADKALSQQTRRCPRTQERSAARRTGRSPRSRPLPVVTQQQCLGQEGGR